MNFVKEPKRQAGSTVAAGDQAHSWPASIEWRLNSTSPMGARRFKAGYQCLDLSLRLRSFSGNRRLEVASMLLEQ